MKELLALFDGKTPVEKTMVIYGIVAIGALAASSLYCVGYFIRAIKK